MNLRFYRLLVPVIFGASIAPAQQPPVLVQSIEMPEVPAGPYANHRALDFKGQRLFTTPQANKAVDVPDLKSGKVMHSVPGFGNPHAILHRENRNRLFVAVAHFFWGGQQQGDLYSNPSKRRRVFEEYLRDAKAIHRLTSNRFFPCQSDDIFWVWSRSNSSISGNIR